MGTKSLKFYNLLALKHLKSSTNMRNLTSLETKELLKKFIKEHTHENSFGSRTAMFQGQNSKIYFDVLKDDEDYLFATIGQKAQAKVQIRDIEKLSSKRIDKNENEIFEAFTYFLLDYKHLIITYITNQHSPNIMNLTNLFDRTDIENGTKVDGFSLYDIRPQMIVEKSTLNSILKQDMLQDVTYEIATPQAHVLGELITNQKLYEHLVEEGIEIKAQIVVSRNKEKGKRSRPLGKVEDMKELLVDMAESVVKSKVKNDSNLKVRTKNEGEILQTFDLLDNKYTYKISWTMDEEKIIREIEARHNPESETLEQIFFDQVNRFIFKRLTEGYEANIERLIELSRKNTN